MLIPVTWVWTAPAVTPSSVHLPALSSFPPHGVLLEAFSGWKLVTAWLPGTFTTYLRVLKLDSHPLESKPSSSAESGNIDTESTEDIKQDLATDTLSHFLCLNFSFARLASNMSQVISPHEVHAIQLSSLVNAPHKPTCHQNHSKLATVVKRKLTVFHCGLPKYVLQGCLTWLVSIPQRYTQLNREVRAIKKVLTLQARKHSSKYKISNCKSFNLQITDSLINCLNKWMEKCILSIQGEINNWWCDVAQSHCAGRGVQWTEKERQFEIRVLMVHTLICSTYESRQQATKQTWHMGRMDGQRMSETNIPWHTTLLCMGYKNEMIVVNIVEV